MNNGQLCEDCGHKSNCQEVYRQLGGWEGASVVFKVLAAFLLPILIFITALAVFGRIFEQIIISKDIQTVLSFFIALFITVCFAAMFKSYNKRRK